MCVYLFARVCACIDLHEDAFIAMVYVWLIEIEIINTNHLEINKYKVPKHLQSIDGFHVSIGFN